MNKYDEHQNYPEYEQKINVNIGRVIHRRRVAMGISRKEMARYIDVSIREIRRMEGTRSAIPAARLEKLKTILNLEWYEFWRDVQNA